MDNKIILIIQLLSSTVVAAVIAGVFTTAKEKNKNRMVYIITERKEWRDKLRELEKSISEIEFSNVNTAIEKKEKLFLIKNYISEFETRLNIFGVYLSNNVLHDSHFWITIYDIYSYDNYDELINSQKLMVLRRYISALLKRDWEISKRDVRGSYGTITLIILDIIIGLYMLIFYVFNIVLCFYQDTLKYSSWFSFLLSLFAGYFILQFFLYKHFRNDGIKNSKYLSILSWSILLINFVYLGTEMVVLVIFGVQIASTIGENKLIFFMISLIPFTLMFLISFFFKSVIFEDTIRLDNDYISVVKSIKRDSYNFSRIEKNYGKRKKEESDKRRSKYKK